MAADQGATHSGSAASGSGGKLSARPVPIRRYGARDGRNIVSPTTTKRNWDRSFWRRLRSIRVCGRKICSCRGAIRDVRLHVGSVK